MCSRSYWHFGRSMVREDVNKNRKILGNQNEKKSHFSTLELYDWWGTLNFSKLVEFLSIITDPCRLRNLLKKHLAFKTVNITVVGMHVWVGGYLSGCSKFWQHLKCIWMFIPMEKMTQFYSVFVVTCSLGDCFKF